MRMKVAAALSADGVTGADAEAAAAEVMAEAEAEEAAEPVAKKGKKRALDSLDSLDEMFEVWKMDENGRWNYFLAINTRGRYWKYHGDNDERS